MSKSDSPTGFKAYALDNEPALWSGTHSLVHPDPVTCGELIERTVDLASVVKDMDPNADVFGPSLYGYYAYLRLQDAPDWSEIAAKNRKKGTPLVHRLLSGRIVCSRSGSRKTACGRSRSALLY